MSMFKTIVSWWFRSKIRMWLTIVVGVLVVGCGVLNYGQVKLLSGLLPIEAAPTLTPAPTEELNTPDAERSEYSDALTQQATTPNPEVTVTPLPTATIDEIAAGVEGTIAARDANATAEAVEQTRVVAVATNDVATLTAWSVTQEAQATLVAAATMLATIMPSPTFDPNSTPSPTPAPISIWVSEDENQQQLLEDLAEMLPEGSLVLHELSCETFMDDVPYSLLPGPSVTIVDHRFGNLDTGPDCVAQLSARYSEATFIVTSGGDFQSLYEGFDITYLKTNKEDWSTVVTAVQQALGLAE